MLTSFVFFVSAGRDVILLSQHSFVTNTYDETGGRMGGHKKTRREQKPTNNKKRRGVFWYRLLPVFWYRLEQIEHLYAYIYTYIYILI